MESDDVDVQSYTKRLQQFADEAEQNGDRERYNTMQTLLRHVAGRPPLFTARQVLSQRLPEPQVHVAGRGKTDLTAVRAANGVVYAYEDKPDGLRASPTTVEVWDVCGDGQALETSILKHVGDADGVERRFDPLQESWSRGRIKPSCMQQWSEKDIIYVMAQQPIDKLHSLQPSAGNMNASAWWGEECTRVLGDFLMGLGAATAAAAPAAATATAAEAAAPATALGGVFAAGASAAATARAAAAARSAAAAAPATASGGVLAAAGAPAAATARAAAAVVPAIVVATVSGDVLAAAATAMAATAAATATASGGVLAAAGAPAAAAAVATAAASGGYIDVLPRQGAAGSVRFDFKAAVGNAAPATAAARLAKRVRADGSLAPAAVAAVASTLVKRAAVVGMVPQRGLAGPATASAASDGAASAGPRTRSQAAAMAAAAAAAPDGGPGAGPSTRSRAVAAATAAAPGGATGASADSACPGTRSQAAAMAAAAAAPGAAAGTAGARPSTWSRAAALAAAAAAVPGEAAGPSTRSRTAALAAAAAATAAASGGAVGAGTGTRSRAAALAAAAVGAEVANAVPHGVSGVDSAVRGKLGKLRRVVQEEARAPAAATATAAGSAADARPGTQCQGASTSIAPALDVAGQSASACFKRLTVPASQLSAPPVSLETMSSSIGKSGFAMVMSGPSDEVDAWGAAPGQAPHTTGPGGAATSACPLVWKDVVRKYAAVGEVSTYAKLFRDGKPIDLVGLWGPQQPEECTKEVPPSVRPQACIQVAAPQQPEEGKKGMRPEAWIQATLPQQPDPLAVSARRIVRQLFTYMVATGVEYGWLSCWEATWLAWRPLDKPGCLRLSRPFLYNTSAQGRATTMAALSWLHAAAMDSWGAGRRHVFSTEGVSFRPSDEDSLVSLDPRAGVQQGAPKPEPVPDPLGCPAVAPQQKGGGKQASKRRRVDGQPSPSSPPCNTVPWLPSHAVQLGHVLGEGSFGTVVRGLCWGEDAAIKLYRGSDAAAEALYEATIYQVLKAQNVGAVPLLFGVGRLLLGTPFLAMRLVHGTPLSALPRITPEVRVAAVAALAEIHAAGVTHGDLRRANMLVEGLPQPPAPKTAAAAQAAAAVGRGKDGRAGGGGSGAGPVRVVFVDLGHACAGASSAMLEAEAAHLTYML